MYVNFNEDFLKHIKQIMSIVPAKQEIIKNANIVALKQIEEILKIRMISSLDLQNIIDTSLSTHNFDSINMSTKVLSDVLSTNYSYLAAIESLKITPMLDSIRNAIINTNYFECFSVINETLRANYLDIADMSFIKNTDLINSKDTNIKYPIGFKSAIRNLNVSTLNQISDSNDFVFEMKTSSFIDRNNEEAKATSNGMNVLCSGVKIFNALEPEYITEVELINFMSLLQDRPTQVMLDKVGIKIKDIIANKTSQIDFDCDQYYHSRAFEENQERPFTADEMVKAPSGVTGPGRYNHPGQAYYYFSNKQKGAESEVRLHNKGRKIQTSVVAKNKPIHMIDLSGEVKSANTFLKYIRFPATGKIPKEYLLPCFVSDCCRDLGIEGIKYYGSQEYSNYVVWNDGYFKFVKMLPLLDPKNE